MSSLLVTTVVSSTVGFSCSEPAFRAIEAALR